MSYYDQHKPHVLEKARRIVTCECGFQVKYSNLCSHKKSASHIIWLQSRASLGQSRKSVNAISDQKETA